MAIQFTCSKCGTRLQVRDEHMGKRLRCPNCKNELPLGQSTAAEAPLEGPSPSVTVDRPWYVTTENGEEFGPVPKAEVDRWVTQGLITARAQMCQQGDAQWRLASEVYPQLGQWAAPAEFASTAQDEIKTDAASSNPYVSPTTTDWSSSVQRGRPHRGGTILTLSILGIACCWPLSVAAWIMGSQDLQEMRQGRMDRSGEDLTKAGMIIGIVGVAILVLTVMVGVLAALA